MDDVSLHIVKNELLSTDADAVKDNKDAAVHSGKKYFHSPPYCC